MHKLQGNFNRNSYIFIQENAFDNVVRKMAAILFRLQHVRDILITLKQLLYIISEELINQSISKTIFHGLLN